ncbi:MAG: hypothetical protein ACM37W_06010 [Actinomycetota bacterium]
MSDPSYQALNLIIKDLNSLIGAIENNPRLSPWVIRQVIKSIKDKAQRMINESEREQNFS